jgi:hypothetical protein
MGPPKPLAGAAIRIKVAIAALAVLAIGAWLAPRLTTVAPSEERAAPLLEEQVMQREAPRPFRGVADLVSQVPVRGVAVHPAIEPGAQTTDDFAPATLPRPPGYGVPLGSGFVLSHRLVMNGERSGRVANGTATAPATLVAYDESTGLLLLRTSPPTADAAAVATTLPASGALIVGAASFNGREVTLPVFVTEVGDEFLRISGDGGAPGMPLFDAEGKLIALTVGPGEARTVRSAIDRLLNRAMAESRPMSFGIATQDNAGALQSMFGEGGVIVVDVLRDGPAASAGIRVGDVITSVNGAAVASSSDLQRALSSDSSAATFTIRRQRKTVTLSAVPITSYDAAALSDRPRPAEVSWAASEVMPADRLRALAIPPDARVLSLNLRTPPSAAAARRDAATSGTIVLLLEHEERRFFVAAGSTP